MEKDTSEIAKLTERLAKDPKSKLFVPLAEEYKKSGDIEMAIQVLMDGLRSNPGYVTARSFLGRLLMDKGDMPGAQKELEEVIKAIPDNLLAQRKLGDLYVLQGRGNDAVQRYKVALALNPGDKELPSLLADLEAGKDVSARIPRPKTQAAQPGVQAQTATTVPVQPKAAPAQPAPAASAAAMKAPVSPPPAQRPGSTPTPASVPAPAGRAQPASASPPAPPVRDEAEIIEDIVDVEALEQLVPASKTKEPASEVPREPFPEPAPLNVVPPALAPFDLSEPPGEVSANAEELTAISWGTKAALDTAAVKPADVEEGGDDLNTNTLAELYISQGFYDKAIEIYQGKLSERPDNRALQLKLEQLRAKAGITEKGGEGFTAVSSASREYAPPAADVFMDAVPAPVKEAPQAPEPAPVDEARQEIVQETVQDTTAPRGPQSATVRRKETIDRLESWLQNILKEKGS